MSTLVRNLRALAFLLLLIVGSGCGDTGTTAPPACVDVCQENEASCDGDRARHCVRAPGACTAWSDTACQDGGKVCRAGACVAISDRQREWASTVADVVDTIETNTGLAPQLHIDVGALKARLENEIFHAADEQIAFFRALRQAVLTYPSGHLGAYVVSACGKPEHPYESVSLLDACTQPYADHAVVSFVRAGNPLGLVAGDEILGVDGNGGAAMMEASVNQPLCAGGIASSSHRRFIAGTSLFTAVHAGTVIKIRHLDGKIEDKTVTTTRPRISCRDPLGREVSGIATGYLRPDGVGVIQVARLHLGPAQLTLPFEEVLIMIRAQLKSALDVVKGAPAIIWDLRANEGGSSPNGLEIVAGTSSAEIGKEVGAYTSREPGTDSFTPRYPYLLEASTALTYGGKVAFAIDGLTISAGDYTARAARVGSKILLVGAPAAGAYGGGGGGIRVGGAPLEVTVSPDSARGEDPMGASLEGHSTEPQIAVELTPQDLAHGKDTVLDRAAAELLK